MLVQLNVRSRNKKEVAVYAESFESSRISGLRDNQDLNNIPALPGWAEFMYATSEDVRDGTATAAVSAAGTKVSYAFASEDGVLDGTATAKDLFFNCAGNWAATENLTISGITIDLTWELWGVLPA